MAPRRTLLRLVALATALAVASAANNLVQTQTCTNCDSAEAGFKVGPDTPPSGNPGSFRVKTDPATPAQAASIAFGSGVSTLADVLVKDISSIAYATFRIAGSEFKLRFALAANKYLEQTIPAGALQTWKTVSHTTGTWVTDALADTDPCGFGYSGGTPCNWAELITNTDLALASTPALQLIAPAGSSDVAVDYLRIKFAKASVKASETLYWSDHCPIVNCNGACSKLMLPGRTKPVWTCDTCNTGTNNIPFIKSNNGRSCMCPPGAFEDSGSSSCAMCVPNKYCPGGARTLVDYDQKIGATGAEVTKATQWYHRGNKLDCEAASDGVPNSLTSLRNSSKITDCFARPGFYMDNIGVVATTPKSTGSQKGLLCADDKYSVGGRIKECTPCPTGLVTTPDHPYAEYVAHPADATVIKAVAKVRNDLTKCKVPPGFHWDGRTARKVKACPRGTYRGPDYFTSGDVSGYIDGWENSDCTRCQYDGVTTPPLSAVAATHPQALSGSGFFTAEDCTFVMAGYAGTKEGGALPIVPKLCEFGYYSTLRDFNEHAVEGSTCGINDECDFCEKCDRGLTTEVRGAKDVSPGSAVCVPNNFVDDVTVDCPARPLDLSFGYDPVPLGDAALKPGQTFQFTQYGDLKSISVYLWGQPGVADGTMTLTLWSLTADGVFDASLGQVTGVTLAHTDAAQCDAAIIQDCHEGDYLQFDFSGGGIQVEPTGFAASAPNYAWELTCTTGPCGFYGYCDFDYYDGGIQTVGQEADATNRNFDTGMIATIIPKEPNPLKAHAGGRKLF